VNINLSTLVLFMGTGAGCSLLGYAVGLIVRAGQLRASRKLAALYRSQRTDGDALDANVRRVRQHERDLLARVLIE